MRKLISTLFVSVILACTFAYGASAHYFIATDTNIRYQDYWNGELVNTYYSWGNNDHPYYAIYEFETIQSNMYHSGVIPKLNVSESGPFGEIKPVGMSQRQTYYTANYGGNIDCTHFVF